MLNYTKYRTQLSHFMKIYKIIIIIRSYNCMIYRSHSKQWNICLYLWPYLRGTTSSVLKSRITYLFYAAKQNEPSSSRRVSPINKSMITCIHNDKIVSKYEISRRIEMARSKFIKSRC